MESDERTRNKDSSFGYLFSRLMREATSLMRKEVELVKAEVSQKTSQMMSGVASIAIAGAVLLSGFLVLLAAAVDGLSKFLPPEMTPWLSALIIGVIVIIVGLIMLQSGRKKLEQQNLTPQRTIDSLRNDQALAKRHEKRAKEQVK